MVHPVRTYERPPSVEVDDQWPARVPEAGVPLSLPVSGAEHLPVQLDGYCLVLVPRAALAVVDDGHKNLVQQVGARLAERVVRLAPAGHHAHLALQRVVALREAVAGRGGRGGREGEGEEGREIGSRGRMELGRKGGREREEEGMRG